MLLRSLTPAPFFGLGRDLDRLVLRDLTQLANDSWVPPVDIHDSAEGIRFTVELPGVAKEQVDVSVKEGVLTIAGEKASSAISDEKSVRLEERSYGRFQRAFRLPVDAETSRIEASHANGVLTVTVPRKPAAQPERIEIK